MAVLFMTTTFRKKPLPSSYELTNLVYTETGSDTDHHIIHISSSVDVTQFLTPANRPSFAGTVSSTYNSTQLNYFWVKQTSGDQTTYDTSIVHVLFNRDEIVSDDTSDDAYTVYISPLGQDTTTCGWKDLPCTTIKYAYEDAGTKNEHFTKIALMTSDGDHSVEQQSVTIAPEPDFTFTGANDSSTASKFVGGVISPASPSALFVISPSDGRTVTFTTINFVLTPADSLKCHAFTVNSGTLQLTSVQITSSTDTSLSLSASLLQLSGGSLNLDSLTATNFIFNNSASFIAVASASPSISFASSHFTAIATADSTSTPSHVNAPTFLLASFSLSNTTITQCTSPSSLEGGAVFLSISSLEHSLTITNCTLQQCACNTQEGRGGFVFLDALPSTMTDSFKTATVPFNLSNNVYTNNDAAIGRDLFIRCHNLSAQITRDQLGVEDTTTFNTTNAFFGTDDCENAGADVDLLSLFSHYRSETIYVSYTDSNAVLHCISYPVKIPNFSLGKIPH